VWAPVAQVEEALWEGGQRVVGSSHNRRGSELRGPRPRGAQTEGARARGPRHRGAQGRVVRSERGQNRGALKGGQKSMVYQGEAGARTEAGTGPGVGVGGVVEAAFGAVPGTPRSTEADVRSGGHGPARPHPLPGAALGGTGRGTRGARVGSPGYTRYGGTRETRLRSPGAPRSRGTQGREAAGASGAAGWGHPGGRFTALTGYPGQGREAGKCRSIGGRGVGRPERGRRGEGLAEGQVQALEPAGQSSGGGHAAEAEGSGVGGSSAGEGGRHAKRHKCAGTQSDGKVRSSRGWCRIQYSTVSSTASCVRLKP